MPSERLVSLMEILKVYAHLYVKKANNLSIVVEGLAIDEGGKAPDAKQLAFLKSELEELSRLCLDGELPVTHVTVLTALHASGLGQLSSDPLSSYALKRLVETIIDRLPDELSTKLFFQLPYARKELFENPVKKWEAVTARFPETIIDVEEASKCFAFSRYPASVFHCVQIIEHGLLPLGRFLSVNDPISGWTAVARELKKIIDKKHEQRSDFEKKHFPFIEQMQGTVEALKNAWRNKISHAGSQRLLLTSSEFTPDTAEEIMTATRSFMRRLAESLPQ